MASLTTDFINSALRSVKGLLHPRENLYVTGTLGALNAELQTFTDGCSTVAIDLRGTFNMTVAIQGSVDGTNWVLIPVRPQIGGVFVLGIVGSAAGVWMAQCSGFTKVRALVTAYTSGSATTVLAGSNALFDDTARNGGVSSIAATATAAAGTGVTLTIAAPGAGLRHYLTGLEINRGNGTAAALTASATLLSVTTTNLPGSFAFTFPADALAAGAVDTRIYDYSAPLMSSAQNTATTIVCPATTGVVWRVTARYYVAP